LVKLTPLSWRLKHFPPGDCDQVCDSITRFKHNSTPDADTKIICNS
jgi:hypothetical protein